MENCFGRSEYFTADFFADLAFRTKAAFRTDGSLLPAELRSDDRLIEKVLEEYLDNSDHGWIHCQQVFGQCCKIMLASPLLVRQAKKNDCLNRFKLEKVLAWSSAIHDLMRFFGGDFRNHQAQAAALAEKMFPEDSFLAPAIANCVRRHDYICLAVDGDVLPQSICDSPAAEIFRLADKISLTPDLEIRRYYETSKRHQTRFFDPDLPDELRFNLRRSHESWDQICYFLILFALQPDDFFFGETRDIYRGWSAGKKLAVQAIRAIALNEEKLEKSQADRIVQIIHDFQAAYQLERF